MYIIEKFSDQISILRNIPTLSSMLDKFKSDGISLPPTDSVVHARDVRQVEEQSRKRVYDEEEAYFEGSDEDENNVSFTVVDRVPSLQLLDYPDDDEIMHSGSLFAKRKFAPIVEEDITQARIQETSNNVTNRTNKQSTPKRMRLTLG